MKPDASAARTYADRPGRTTRPLRRRRAAGHRQRSCHKVARRASSARDRPAGPRNARRCPPKLMSLPAF